MLHHQPVRCRHAGGRSTWHASCMECIPATPACPCSSHPHLLHGQQPAAGLPHRLGSNRRVGLLHATHHCRVCELRASASRMEGTAVDVWQRASKPAHCCLASSTAPRCHTAPAGCEAPSPCSLTGRRCGCRGAPAGRPGSVLRRCSPPWRLHTPDCTGNGATTCCEHPFSWWEPRHGAPLPSAPQARALLHHLNNLGKSTAP